MTSHDAAIGTFRQWWRRTMRGGYAYALVASPYGVAPEHHGVKEILRALVWSALLPVAIVLGAFQQSFYALLLLYPLHVIRLACRRGARNGMFCAYGFFMTMTKFAESAGIFGFYRGRLLNKRPGIIEYK